MLFAGIWRMISMQSPCAMVLMNWLVGMDWNVCMVLISFVLPE
jgi:hypothetical protein